MKMSKWRVALATVAMASLPGTSAWAQKPPTLEIRIKAELVKQVFRTKMRIGNTLLREGVSEADAIRLVDTNVFPDGRVLYNLRTSLMGILAELRPVVAPTCATNRPEAWIKDFREGRLCVLEPNTSVQVVQVDLEGDRIEVYLAAVPGNWYGKLKFMFGKDWQKTRDFESVIEDLSGWLWIDRIERSKAVARSYQELLQKVRDLSAESVEPPDARLKNAQELKWVLNNLISNRREHEKLGHGATAKEVADYQARLAEVDLLASQLAAEAKKERIKKVLADYAVAEAEPAKWRSTLGGAPVRTQSELKSREDLISLWEGNLRAREELERNLSSLGESVPPKWASARDSEQQDIKKYKTDFAAIGPRLRLVETNSVYAKMKSEEAGLKSLYVAAFATPRQAAVATQFRNHLQGMIANREAAQGMGDSSAAAEIRRLRTQIAGIR